MPISSMESFIFNQLIDPATITDLYENDYAYIEKIFQTALINLEGDLETVRFCHSSGDREGLRKAIHKLKPTFGFLGMTVLEQQCSDFEKNCGTGLPVKELSQELVVLLQQIDTGKKAVEEDHRKLIIFNNT